ARFGQAGFAQHGLDLYFARAVKHRRREVNAVAQRFGQAQQLAVIQAGDLFGKRSVLEDAPQFTPDYFFARVFFQESGNALAQLMTGPAQVRLQNLSHVHTAGNAQGIEHDLHRRAVRQIRHIFFWQNACDHALVAVTSSHFVANAQLALHGDVHLHQLDDTGRQFVTLLQFADTFVGDLAQHVNLPRGHLFDFVDLLVHAGIFIGILDALQVTRRDALDGLAVQHGALGQQALVGALVMQVSLDF